MPLRCIHAAGLLRSVEMPLKSGLPDGEVTLAELMACTSPTPLEGDLKEKMKRAATAMIDACDRCDRNGYEIPSQVRAGVACRLRPQTK